MRHRGSGLRGRRCPPLGATGGEAGQIAVRLSTIHSRSRCGSSQTTEFSPSPTVDAIRSTAADGRVPPVHATTVAEYRHQRAQHRPANVGFSGAEGAIRALRALRLCRSSRPRLERGGRRIPASHQSRCRKLLAASDGSSRKPQPTLAIRGLRSGPRRASAWRTAMWTRSLSRRRPREAPRRDRRIHHSQAGDSDGGYGYLPKSPCQPHPYLGLHPRKRLEIETVRRRL